MDLPPQAIMQDMNNHPDRNMPDAPVFNTPSSDYSQQSAPVGGITAPLLPPARVTSRPNAKIMLLRKLR